MTTPLNTTIVNICNNLISSAPAERFDIAMSLVKHQGLILLVSFIVIPLLLFIILSAMIGIHGRVTTSQIIIVNGIIMLISMIIGIIIYLLLNVYSIPVIT